MRNQEVSGLKGLLDKAKTSLEVWNLVREDETYWQTKDRKWVSEKDVVEFFKDKIVVDRKQVEEIGNFLVLGSPAIFPYVETEYDKGYSKGYYDARDQVIEKIKELVEGEK